MFTVFVKSLADELTMFNLKSCTHIEYRRLS